MGAALQFLTDVVSSHEATLALCLVMLSFALRALIGKPGAHSDFTASLLFVPIDVAFAAISFLIPLVGDYSKNHVSMVLLVFYFVMLLFIYWLQVCSEKNHGNGQYVKMVIQLFGSLSVSLVMLLYALNSIISLGTR